MVLMWDLWNFSFFSPGGVSPTIPNLSLCFGVISKTSVSSPKIILLNKIFVCIGHCDNVLARCDSMFPLLRCQGVWNKMCTQLCLSQTLFHNPKNYSLEDVQRFCYHSWCDSTVIFDQISNSWNVYLRSSQFWTDTSRHLPPAPPSVLKSRKPSKNVWLVHSLILISLLHQYQCVCCR